MDREVAVWFVDGVPVRLVWEGRRYRVNDTPTPLAPDDVWHPAITHPPRAWHGWRFQAVDTEGRASVFDIRRFESQQHWQLVAVHDDRYATAVPSSSTSWPGITSRVTPSSVVGGAALAAPSREASTP